ncbi:MAG: hypothetical protein HZC28_09965 [Spirochaetes bacterium]|nr:hypothetical protein [Spirochaetota bacterium]
MVVSFKRMMNITLLGAISAVTICSAAYAMNIGTNEKRVWCHYVAWHFATDVSYSAITHYDFAWRYPVKNEAGDYRDEMSNAVRSGIDGFFVDVVMNADSKSVAFTGQTIAMLNAYEGTPFMVGICLDGAGTKDTEWYVKKITEMITNICTHPNYPVIDGKPVFITYGSMGRTPDGWRDVRRRLKETGYEIFLIGDIGAGYDKKMSAEKVTPYNACFDMFYSFGSFHRNDSVFQPVAESAPIVCKAARDGGRSYMPCLWPGYLGGWLGGRNDYYQPYRGFDQLFENFDTMRKTGGEWLHITTWNDLEETPMYPMLFTFHANTELLKAFTGYFKGAAPEADVPRVYFAYHREEIIGTLLRIEAMSIPTRAVSAAATVSGYLSDNDGKKCCELAPKSVSTKDFSRAEWQIPTADYCYSPCVVPTVRIETKDGYLIERKLPAVFLKSGWIQNQVTVRVPPHEMATNEARLLVQQQGTMITARLSLGTDVSVTHATLWRNDRPIGEFGTNDGWLAYLEIRRKNVPKFTAAISGGTFIDANQFGQAKSESFKVSPQELFIEKTPSWSGVMMAALRNDGNAVLTVKASGTETNLSLNDICAHQGTYIDVKGGSLHIKPSEIDCFIMDHSPLNVRSGTLSLTLDSRPAHENDIFYARIETSTGTVFYSSAATPFAASQPRSIPVTEAFFNLETLAEAPGIPLLSGFLETPAQQTPVVRKVSVHPANFLAGRWTFENGFIDTLGERDLPVWENRSFLTSGGHDGGTSMTFTGTNSLKLRLRSWPLGACTIDLYLKPKAGRSGTQSIIKRGGGSSAVTLSLLPDGTLNVMREGKRAVVSDGFMTTEKLVDDSWNRVRITFDETALSARINGKPAGSKTLQPGREHFNCTIVLGGNYTGALDDLAVFSVADDRN